MDLMGLMKALVSTGKISISDFWQMPLSLVFEMVGLFTPPEKQSISRKRLIDNEKEINRMFG